MLIKIKVDDFWLDEEGELEPALKQHVIRSAVTQIKQSVNDQFEKLIMAKIKESVDALAEKHIDDMLNQFIESGTVRKPGQYSSDPTTEVPLKQYMEDLFMKSKHWKPSTHIDRFCKKFGEVMKLQYNAAFANQIVVNLKEQGMLKDEVVNALLTGPKEGK